MVEALVTPRLIRWARERRRLPIAEAAEKISVKPDKLQNWENGIKRPTFKQAMSLAEKLYVPFGYLFLTTPPEETLPLPDFRIVTGRPANPPSPDFLDVLSDTLRKQQWYKEYQESMDAPRLEFIGRFNQEDNHYRIAGDVRNTLQINENMRGESHNWEQFLQEFIHRSERIGILVLRNGIVGNNPHRPLDVDEFRGFVICDALAPVIFINGKDAKTAQIFTLAHELAHLWLGQTGVSNPDYLNNLATPQNTIERLANQIAAEVLLPADELINSWDTRKETEDNIQDIALRFKISQFVVLRRAFDNDKVSEAQYYEFYQRLIAEHHRGAGASGGNFFRSLLARNSHTLTTTLLVAYAEGRVSQKEVASLLNVKIKSIPSIQREILGGTVNA